MNRHDTINIPRKEFTNKAVEEIFSAYKTIGLPITKNWRVLFDKNTILSGIDMRSSHDFEAIPDSISYPDNKLVFQSTGTNIKKQIIQVFIIPNDHRFKNQVDTLREKFKAQVLGGLILTKIQGL